MSDFGSSTGSSSSSSSSDLTNGNGGKMGETINRGYEQARDQIQQAYGAARQNLRHADSYLRDQMRERPMTAAATAVGIGLVLGLMLSGRRS